MAIESIVANATHGIIQIECWDGKAYFLKDLQTAHLSDKSSTFEQVKEIMDKKESELLTKILMK